METPAVSHSVTGISVSCSAACTAELYVPLSLAETAVMITLVAPSALTCCNASTNWPGEGWVVVGSGASLGRLASRW